MSDSMSVTEAGHVGGEMTKKRYGREFYQRIGKKGGSKHAQNLKENGISPELHEQYVVAGQKGGNSTKRKFGHEFYVEIGRKGGSASSATEV